MESCKHNISHPIRARHQLQLDQWDGAANKTGSAAAQTCTRRLRTTDPNMPQFPSPVWPNPLTRSVWTCRAQPPVPRTLSRHHTTLALSLYKAGLFFYHLDLRDRQVWDRLILDWWHLKLFFSLRCWNGILCMMDIVFLIATNYFIPVCFWHVGNINTDYFWRIF